MKSKESKYEGAVERNIKFATKNKVSREKLQSMSLVNARIFLGIRKDDTTYDDRIIQLRSKKQS